MYVFRIHVCSVPISRFPGFLISGFQIDYGIPADSDSGLYSGIGFRDCKQSTVWCTTIIYEKNVFIVPKFNFYNLFCPQYSWYNLSWFDKECFIAHDSKYSESFTKSMFKNRNRATTRCRFWN